MAIGGVRKMRSEDGGVWSMGRCLGGGWWMYVVKFGESVDGNVCMCGSISKAWFCRSKIIDKK